jgi:hypothetical protein
MALLSLTEMTRTLCLIVLLVVSAQHRVQAQAPGSEFDEYQVKAAFLYNFAKFVEWPSDSFANSADPIGICIVGQNPFGLTLETMMQGKKEGGRAFAVRRLPDTQQVSNCHILFISAAERKRTRTLLTALKGVAILTVGETDDFMALGGVIAFKRDGMRVHIQIDVQMAEQDRLKISSKLLSLAEIVKPQL